jgi:hypothetical protein
MARKLKNSVKKAYQGKSKKTAVPAPKINRNWGLARRMEHPRPK